MILSIDPGGTTGVARLSLAGELSLEQVEGGADGMWSWLNTLDWERISAVACETFVLRPGAKSSQNDAVWIIGAVRYLCATHWVPFFPQSPAQAKSFATNDALKAVGWYTTADHARDAARHLLVLVAGNPIASTLVPGTRARVLELLTAR